MFKNCHGKLLLERPLFVTNHRSGWAFTIGGDIAEVLKACGRSGWQYSLHVLLSRVQDRCSSALIGSGGAALGPRKGRDWGNHRHQGGIKLQ